MDEDVEEVDEVDKGVHLTRAGGEHGGSVPTGARSGVSVPWRWIFNHGFATTVAVGAETTKLFLLAKGFKEDTSSLSPAPLCQNASRGPFECKGTAGSTVVDRSSNSGGTRIRIRRRRAQRESPPP